MGLLYNVDICTIVVDKSQERSTKEYNNGATRKEVGIRSINVFALNKGPAHFLKQWPEMLAYKCSACYHKSFETTNQTNKHTKLMRNRTKLSVISFAY